MSLTVPPAVNYPNPLYFIPNNMLAGVASLYGDEPTEGAGSIAVEIDWDTMGGANHVVAINPNASTAAQNQISQIASLFVNNSSSESDVTFVFTDTGLEITVPAGSGGVFPVVTNATQFFVQSDDPQVGDITRFLILNTLLPPVDFAQPSLEQGAAAFKDIAPAAGDTQLVASTVNGEITGISVYYQLSEGGGNKMTWQLVDGTGAVLFGGQFSDSGGGPVNQQGPDLSGLEIPFSEGLKFVQVLAAGGGFAAHSGVAVNILYRTAP
jgi:hypothetical protein